MRRRFGDNHREEPYLSRSSRYGQISPLLPSLLRRGGVRSQTGLFILLFYPAIFILKRSVNFIA